MNLPRDASEGTRTQLQDQDVLISITADIGIIGYVSSYVPKPAYINQHIALVRFDSSDTNPKFIIYFLASEKPQKLFRTLTDAGAKAGMNLTTVRKIPIVLPPTKSEQDAIAEVLGDAGALIESLEQLIAAKTEFKRGLMQQLLTGRTRFEEFEGQEWKQAHLSDVAIESELRNNGRLTEKSLYAVTKAYGMIPMRERVQGESVERCKVVSKDWFAYNPMRLNIGSIAKWDNEEDVLVSPDYVVFRCDETRLDPDFLNHYRRSHRWTKFVEKSGDGSVRVRIWFSHLAELKLSLPPLPEQRRIAAVLNACDRELDLLREQLVEFKKQKQGLMQKLLTGQIRVKVDEAQAIGV
ncbi:MAG: restriction endonuclease subunit S [Blastocatellia bacterium]